MSVLAAAADTRVSTPRRIGFLVSAGLLSLLTAAFAIVVLIGAMSGERTVHRVHDVAGSIMLAMMAAGFLGTLLTRGRTVAPLQQVLVMLAVFFSVDLATGRLGASFFVFAALAAPVVALHPRRGALLTLRRPSPVLGTAVLIGAVPLTWYALAQIALQRGAHVGDPHAHPEGHYAGMAMMALALVLVGLVASLRSDGWRVPAWSAGLGVALFGVASMSTPLLLGAAPPPGGLLAVFGGAVFIALAELEAWLGGSKPPRPGDSANLLALVL